MSDYLQDVRFAGRLLARNPLFTAAIVATLALGIGLNTAVFSAVHAMLLRSLPGVEAPDRLVQVYRTNRGDFLYGSNSVPHYRDVRERADVFSGVAIWTFVPLDVSVDGRSERIMGQLVSENYFDVLGVPAARGRTFLPEEGVGVNAHAVAVLSHAFWRDRFGGEDVVGRTLRLNGRDYEVVGVTPAAFRGAMPEVVPTVWVPLTMQPQVMGVDRLEARGSNFFNMVARLEPGVTADRAQAALNRVNASLEEIYPDNYEGRGMLVVPETESGLHPELRSAQIGFSAVMIAVVAMLLLIACVNVANLLLSRAGARRNEMAVRISIGAGRGRLLRQLLTESLLLSLVAGVAGLAVAAVAIAVLNRVRLPIDIPISFGFTLDGPVLLFAFGASVATSLVFGLVPALAASRPQLVPALKNDSARTPVSRSRLSGGLVIAQIGLSVLLLAGAGLFARNLRAATSIDTGFDADGVLLAAVDPGLQGYDDARTRQFYDRLLERVRGMPGVQAAGIGETVPLGLSSQDMSVEVPGRTAPENERSSFDYNIVGPGYFDALGITVRGRAFDARDDTDATPVVIINERMAQRFWPGGEAIGRRISTGGAEREVIGVVPTGKYASLGEDPLDFMYLPHAQYFNSAMTLHVRTTTSHPESLLPRLRDAIRSLDADLPVYDVRTMHEHLGIALMPARLASTVLALFGLLGLGLAAVGVYGVMAYAVARRTREIGIRVALGARRGTIVGLLLRQGGQLVAAGVTIGIAAAIGGARLVRGLLYAPVAFDPITFLAVPAALAGIALMAVYLPARRAASIDPVMALKAE